MVTIYSYERMLQFVATAIHKTSKLAITSPKAIDKLDAPPPNQTTVGLPKL